MTTKNRLKKILSLAVMLGAFMAFGGLLQAEVLVYEPFDYTGGVEVPGLTVNATGLTGTWRGDGDPLGKIKGGSLTYGDLPTAGNRWGPAAVWSQPWIEADLDSTVMAGHLDDGDELWFSYVGQLNLANASDGGATNGSRFRIGSDENNYIGIHAQKIAIETG